MSLTKFVSRADLAGSRVDRDAGVIKGVSLVSLGQARGHNKFCDKTTLEQVRDCAKQYEGGLRVKFNPKTFNHGDGTLIGFIAPDSLKLTGSKLTGDLHVYSNAPSDMVNYLYEIAERTPGNIGLSIEFIGMPEEKDGDKFARCDEIFAATIVDLPAANATGLFAADLTNLKDHNKHSNKEKDVMTTEELEKLTTAITMSIEKGFEKFAATFPKPKDIIAAQKADQKNDDDDKELMSAAGVTADDDNDTKAAKIKKYRDGKGLEMTPSNKQPIMAMSQQELAELITKTQLQFFKQTGNRPARVSAEPEGNGNTDPFEGRIQKHIENGARSRGLAIQRARRDAPKEYNQWMARKHPVSNQLVSIENPTRLTR